MLKIEIDSTVIAQALKIVSTLAPPMTGNVIISAVGPHVTMISIGTASRCQLKLPCQRTGEGIFALPLPTITAAVRGRLVLTLQYNNDVLNITSGSYKTTLATVDVIQEPGDTIDGLEGHIITKHQSEWLQQALSDIYIKPDSLLNQTSHHVAVQMSSNGAFVCCYDGDRMAYAVSPDITGDMDTVLPYNTIHAVATTFGMTAFKLATVNGVMYVWNKVGVASMSMIAPAFTVPVESLMGRIEESRHKPDAVWKLDTDQTKTFLQNAKAITNLDSKNTLQVRVGKKSSHLRVATPNGSSQVEIDASASHDTDFCIDYDYFGEFLTKGPSTVNVHPTYISMHDQDFGMIVSLNQPVS